MVYVKQNNTGTRHVRYLDFPDCFACNINMIIWALRHHCALDKGMVISTVAVLSSSDLTYTSMASCSQQMIYGKKEVQR